MVMHRGILHGIRELGVDIGWLHLLIRSLEVTRCSAASPVSVRRPWHNVKNTVCPA